VTDPRIYVAIVIGVAATWPALFLYERVLKLMAFLQDWQEQEGGGTVSSLARQPLRVWDSLDGLRFYGFHHPASPSFSTIALQLNGTGKRVRAFLLLHALRAGSGFLSTDAGARHHARATSSTSRAFPGDSTAQLLG
jgi:hypothetical protein